MEMLLRDITVFTFDIPYIYIYTWIALLGRTAAPDKPSSCATFRRKKKKSMKNGVVSQILHVKLEKVLLIIPIHVCIDIHEFNFVI